MRKFLSALLAVVMLFSMLPAVTAESLVQITKQPTNVVADLGETATFTVTATGAVSYQWQWSKNNSTWSNGSSTSNSASYEATDARYGYYYRCKMLDENGGEAFSNVVRIIKPADFSITKQPVSVEAAIGEEVKFTVEATDVSSYQWQYSSDGKTWKSSTASGAKTATMTTEANDSRYAYQYRCKMVDVAGAVHYSNAVRMIKPVVEFSITKQPVSVEAELGETVTFTVEAKNAASYQWQWSKDSTTWYNGTNEAAKTASVSYEATSTRYTYYFRCLITDVNGEQHTTNVVRITKPVVALVITKQPVSVEAAIGDTVKFSVEATGAVSYVWQYSSDNATWKNSTATGAKTATMTTEANTSRYNYYYRCKMTDNQGNVYTTNSVRMIKPVDFAITKQPTAVEAELGETVKFTVEATGVASYQWQWSANGTAWYDSTAAAATTASISYEATTSRYNYYFRCVLTGNNGEEKITNVVRIYKPVEFAITKQPVSVEAAIGETITFSVEATGVSAYQWQWSANGTAWYDSTAAAATTASISYEANTSRYNYHFRCVLTDTKGEEHITNVVRITKPVAFAITKQPVSVEAAIGETVVFTVEATGAVTYVWQYSSDNATWRNSTATGAKTASMTTEANTSRYNYYYRCQMTDASGATYVTDSVRMIKPVALAITKQPTHVEAELGETVKFTVEATGVASYQWQWSANGTAWYDSTAAAATTASISYEVTTSRYNYHYRCVLTGKNGEELITNVVRINKPVEFAIIAQPVTVEAELGETVEFTVEATGVANYQWQWSSNGTTWYDSTAAAATTATITYEATTSRYNYYFRCVLTDTKGEEHITDVVRIEKPEPLAIVTQPVSVEAELGETVEFTVEATGVATYQWQWSSNGTNWYDSTAAAASTATISYEVTEARYSYQFRCVLTGKDGTELITDVVKIIGDIVIDDVVYKKLTDTTLYVYKYNGSAATLTIPEVVEGKTVVEIGEEAFMGNTTLTTIDLPDTITAIRARAFKNCTKLANMK